MSVAVAPRLNRRDKGLTRLFATDGGCHISQLDSDFSEEGFEMFGRDGLDGSAVPLADRRVTAVPVDDNMAIYDEVGHVLIMLNPSASAVLEMCDGTTSADEIVDRLSKLYVVAESELRSDVWLTLLKLASLGLVRDAR